MIQKEITFYEFWLAAKPNKEYSNRFRAAEKAWRSRSPIAQQAMLREMVEQDGLAATKNPYFYIIDFKEPCPFNWNGHVLDKTKRYITAKWNGKWGLYTVEEAERYEL